MRMSGVYTRAQRPDGKPDTVDVMELTHESFKLFVIDRMYRAGMVEYRGEAPERHVYEAVAL